MSDEFSLSELYPYLTWNCPLHDKNYLTFIARIITSYVGKDFTLTAVKYYNPLRFKDNKIFQTYASCVSSNGSLYIVRVEHIVKSNYWYETVDCNPFFNFIDTKNIKDGAYMINMVNKFVKDVSDGSDMKHICVIDDNSVFKKLNILPKQSKSTDNYNNNDNINDIDDDKENDEINTYCIDINTETGNKKREIFENINKLINTKGNPLNFDEYKLDWELPICYHSALIITTDNNRMHIFFKGIHNVWGINNNKMKILDAVLT